MANPEIGLTSFAAHLQDWPSELGLSTSRRLENRVGNMRTMSLPFVTAVLAATLAGCSPATQRTGGVASENGSSQSTEVTAVVSQREIASAKTVLMRHLEALSAGDTQVLLETSPEYRRHIFTQSSWPDQARSWAGLKVVSVATPGQYLGDEAMRQVCREALGRLPYQVAVFHVVAARPSAPRDGQETDLDVVLIRPSADSGWLVHDMGR